MADSQDRVVRPDSRRTITGHTLVAQPHTEDGQGGRLPLTSRSQAVTI